eukprot:11135775-Heterocapsa_arctica.AAC.1
MDKERRNLEEGDKKRQTIEESAIEAEDNKHQLTCIVSVGHEVDKINGGSKKRSNNEQTETSTKATKNSKVNHAHIEQDTNTSQADKEKHTGCMQILHAKNKN